MSTRAHKSAMHWMRAAGEIGQRFEALEAKARAVVAAGRPHYGLDNLRIPEMCGCPKCSAWDALAELLKTP